MSTIISTVLIAVPPAFLLGWILSKALFRHISLTRPATALRDKVSEPAVITQVVARDQGNTTTASKHKDAQMAAARDAGRKLNSLRNKLAGALANIQSMQSEIQLLKEAAAEREHTVIELKRKLQMQLAVPEEKPGSAPANQKQFIKMMEERQAIYELRAEELSQELEAANARANRTVKRFHNWRQKIRPLAKQIRQQRVMINELREELSQPDLAQQSQEVAERVSHKSIPVQQVKPSPDAALIDSRCVQEEHISFSAGLVTELAVTSDSVKTANDLAVYVAQENLQKLRGVGPAMHQKLNEQGIYRLKQLALMSSQEFSDLGDSLGIGQKTLAKHQWPLQARQLLNMPEAVAETETAADEAIPA